MIYEYVLVSLFFSKVHLALSCSFIFPRSLARSLFHSLAVSLCPSLKFAHARARPISWFLALPFFLSLSLSRSLSLFLSLSLAFALSLSLILSLFLALSLSPSLSFSFSVSFCLSLSLSVSRFLSCARWCLRDRNSVALPHSAHRSALQCVMQCVAVHCNVSQSVSPSHRTHGSALQMLQCVAVRCSVL